MEIYNSYYLRQNCTCWLFLCDDGLIGCKIKNLELQIQEIKKNIVLDPDKLLSQKKCRRCFQWLSSTLYLWGWGWWQFHQSIDRWFFQNKNRNLLEIYRKFSKITGNNKPPLKSSVMVVWKTNFQPSHVTKYFILNSTIIRNLIENCLKCYYLRLPKRINDGTKIFCWARLPFLRFWFFFDLVDQIFWFFFDLVDHGTFGSGHWPFFNLVEWLGIGHKWHRIDLTALGEPIADNTGRSLTTMTWKF